MPASATSKTVQTTIRINESLKNQASELCESMGISLNSYINMATRQLVNQRRIPFEVVAATPTPTAKTHRAMVEAEAKALGLIPDELPSFTDAESLIEYLDEA